MESCHKMVVSATCYLRGSSKLKSQLALVSSYPYHGIIAQRPTTFSLKGHVKSIFGFARHKVSVTTTQLCQRVKAAIDNM